ncbi:MAG TPA: TRCF domain-containing protein, partial [Tianweitania sediminis]|nr:TRCF domain-containing protein [Tianweitania sediminis]
STLVAFDRLGSGLAISARDLDLRGAGDLMGEDQAGHMKLIGVSLYQRLLAQAVDAARGQGNKNNWEAELNLGMSGSFPATYVPEPAVRLNLYARLLRFTRAEEVDAFADEIDDRFGELPQPVITLLELARLKIKAREQDVRKVDAGPLALALDFRKPPTDAFWKRMLKKKDVARRDDRLIWSQPTEPGLRRLKAVAALLDAMAQALQKPSRKKASGD